MNFDQWTIQKNCLDVKGFFSKKKVKVELVRTSQALNLAEGSIDSIKFLQVFHNQKGEDLAASEFAHLIEYKYDKLYFKIVLLATINIAFCVFHATFAIFFVQNSVVATIMLILTLFYIMIEVYQMFIVQEYFHELQNIFDVLGMGTFVIWFMMHETEVTDAIQIGHNNYLLATANALICFKGIMHLRIFQEMRVLINMIG